MLIVVTIVREKGRVEEQELDIANAFTKILVEKAMVKEEEVRIFFKDSEIELL